MNTPSDTVIKRDSAALIALSIGFFMIMIDVTAISVVLPNMELSLGDGIVGLQWIMDSYNFAFACLLLTAGRMADLIQAKTVFLSGVILFLIASLGSGLAPSLETVICFRFIQGIAAALILPASLALISHFYTHPEKQAYIIGIWSSIAGLGAASGPILGAYLNSTLGWRAVFFINIPFGLIAFIVCLRKMTTRPSSQNPSKIDLPGLITSTLSIGLLVFSIIETTGGFFSHFIIPIVLFFFLLTVFMFVKIERKTTSPMVPLVFFKSPQFSLAILIGMLINFAFFGELFQLALYFKSRGYSSLLIGLAILSHTGLSPFASYLAGKITSKLGALIPIILGMLVGSLALFAFMLLIDEHSPFYLTLIFSIMAIGFSCMFIVTAATIMLTQSVANQHTGIASAIFFTARQIGSLIGIALFGTIITRSSSLTSGIKYNLMIAALLFFIAGLISWHYWAKSTK